MFQFGEFRAYWVLYIEHIGTGLRFSMVSIKVKISRGVVQYKKKIFSQNFTVIYIKKVEFQDWISMDSFFNFPGISIFFNKKYD